MERNDSILGGALLLTAANLLLRLISIAFQVFLSVRIGAAGLGLMQLISTIGVFAMLAGTAGVRVTAMYLAAEEFGHRRLSGVRAAMRACLQYGILVSAVSGAALFFLSDFFAMEWLRAGLNTAEQLLIPIGLARYGGSTEEAMAGYGTIHGMVFPILMFPAAILYSVSDLLVPELSRCRAMGRSLRVRDLSGKCIRMTILFAAAVAGFFFVCAEELGQCVYHSADAGRYLRIFAPMVLMLYLDAIVDGMLKGLAEQLSCVRYNTLTSVLDVVFLYVLLPRHGVAGYVAVFAVTHAINLYLSIRRLLVVTEHRPRTADFALPLLSLGLALLLTLPFPAAGGWLKPFDGESSSRTPTEPASRPLRTAVTA